MAESDSARTLDYSYFGSINPFDPSLGGCGHIKVKITWQVLAYASIPRCGFPSNFLLPRILAMDKTTVERDRRTRTKPTRLKSLCFTLQMSSCQCVDKCSQRDDNIVNSGEKRDSGADMREGGKKERSRRAFTACI